MIYNRRIKPSKKGKTPKALKANQSRQGKTGSNSDCSRSKA